MILSEDSQGNKNGHLTAMNPKVEELLTDSHHVYMSKADMVTGALRELLINGELGPGDPLPQRQLAERFDVSPTPVREALRRLEAEGLVSFDLHRGSSVVAVDFGATRENYRIRAALEALGAELAAETITEEDIRDLEGLIEEMEHAEGDSDRIHQLNRDFHFRIYETASSPLLISLIKRLWSSFPKGPQVVRPHSESISQHRTLVEALRARDGDKAHQVMWHHIMDVVNRL